MFLITGSDIGGKMQLKVFANHLQYVFVKTSKFTGS